MARFSFSLTEVKPFLDSNGDIIQMRNFEWTVSATQEDGETEEQTRLQVREEFEKQRQYIYSKSPIDKLAEKRILFLGEQLKKKLSDEEYIKVKTEFNNL